MTVPKWQQLLFLYRSQQEGLSTFLAKTTNPHAGCKPTDLNQLFVRDAHVYSMQLKIISDLRKAKIDAEILTNYLSRIMEEIPQISREYATRSILPSNFEAKLI
jgi:hypothetical protein